MRVIYHCEKRGPRPAARADAVFPELSGEGYSYLVPKFWIVDAILPDGRIVLRTRRGKTHYMDPGNPHLRPARWWERLRFADRFPVPNQHPDRIAPKTRHA